LPEGKLSAGVEAEIRDLRVTAFPEFADFISRSSYRGSVPEYRLVGRAATGELVTHLEFGCRQALVGTEPVGILGIGAVAVHPRTQGRGIGRRLFGALSQYAIQERLADFGFLECREAVAGFYERVSTAGGDAAGPRSRRQGPLMRRAESWPAVCPKLASAAGVKPMSTRVTSYGPTSICVAEQRTQRVDWCKRCDWPTSQLDHAGRCVICLLRRGRRLAEPGEGTSRGRHPVTPALLTVPKPR